MAWMDEPRREPFAESAAVTADGDVALITRRLNSNASGSVLDRSAAGGTGGKADFEKRSDFVADHLVAGAASLRLPEFLTRADRRVPGVAYLIFKRVLDVVVASSLLVLLFPLLLLVGLAIVLEDRGPMLYYQTRVGKNGKEFRFYKFRSMVRNADALKGQLASLNESDGPAFKMRNDPRITRVGRFLRRSSVDELPQLLNVLRGEMSLVGPRPHLPREVAQYTERQKGRLAVQPGLLCLREVLGRSNVSFEQWVEWDLLYIEHRSLRTDLWILGRTVPAVLKADGAY
jgi:Sugar transferases involved in lipopolysaccharide synthesis